MTSFVKTLRATSDRAEGWKFSIITCLFVGAFLLATETLPDLLVACQLHQVPIIAPVMRSVNLGLAEALRTLHLPMLLGFWVQWWTPVLIISLLMSIRSGRSAMLYTCAGTAIYLVISHNFRGLAPRHNVFEWADQIRQQMMPGLPPPFVLDLSYFAAALIGSALGWPLHNLYLRRKLSPKVNFGDKATLMMATICLLFGIVEALVAHFMVEPQDRWMGGEPYTQGYALILFSVVTWIIILFRERLFDFELT